MPDLCLRVRGDAMDDAGLVEGSIVALARKLDAEERAIVADGDIVAGRIAGDVVLRRVHGVDATTWELRAQSTNPDHTSIRLDARSNDVEIIGVVIGRMLPGAG